MKIVAFLQNPWHPDSHTEAERKLYREDQEFHKVMLSRSMSGRRLLNAFGEALFNEIWWDNASVKSGKTSRGVTRVSQAHIDEVIKREKPDLILTFGEVAANAIVKSLSALTIPQLQFPHPNTMGIYQSEIDKCAQIVREHIMNYDLLHEHHQ